MGVVKQAMNAGTVKQILVGLAKKITDIQDAPSPEERQSKLPASLPTIRGGAIMPQRVAEACSQALDDITKMTEPDGLWSRLSVDEVVWAFARSVMDLAPEQRKDGVRAAIEKASERFRQDPSTWVVDILVYGIHVSCAGLTFGKILFLGEDMGKADLAVSFPDFPTGAQIFARMETEAIDDESALLRAYKILDEHLMILNALCSQEVPSWIQVSRSNITWRSYSACRVGPSSDSMGSIRQSGHNHKFPLMGVDLDGLLKDKLGKRISQMLAGPATEFSQRLLLGYQFAGAACVDLHPERSFLMLAIALESVVLGKENKSELTYQLASRVAHLIGNGLDGRRLVVKTVSDFYERRSRIVHAGQYGVSPREMALLFFYCTTALALLAVSPAFAGFKTNAELDGWFKDRMLDGPNHFTPEPPIEAQIPSS